MATRNWVTWFIAGLGIGCGSTMSTGGGAREYSGELALVFTNASPDALCRLHMSAADADGYGDNWLPAQGLPSGKSIEFRVKRGTYKARWESCIKDKGIPRLAATLTRDAAFTIDQETQLYAYIADTVSPTSRAAMLDRTYKKVRFQGQSVGPSAQASAQTPEPAPEPDIGPGSGPATKPGPTKPGKPQTANASFDGFVDRSARKPKGKASKGPAPSLRRTHDLANSRAGYRAK
jgi:hypothetical protein